MYSSVFCRVYNEFGWNVYPEVFAEELLAWLAHAGIAVKSALDLGCGTGILCRKLSEAGISACGVDLSADMIAVARENAPDLSFSVGDMTCWKPEGPVDLVTCTGDALNHLFSLSDVEKVFVNVAGCLQPGGLFVFDLLNEREIPDDEPFTLDYDERTRAVFRTTREDDVIRLHIEVFDREVQTVSEDIRERLHDVDAVTGLLEKAGLPLLQRGHKLLPGECPEAATWFIIARK